MTTENQNQGAAIHRQLHDHVYDALRTLETYDLDEPDAILAELVPVADFIATILDIRLAADAPEDPEVIARRQARKSEEKPGDPEKLADQIHDDVGAMRDMVDVSAFDRIEQSGVPLEQLAKMTGEARTLLEDSQRDEPEAFTVPQILGKRRADQDPWTDCAHSAAQKHEKHLTKALDKVSDAKALAETLRYALLNDNYDTIFAPEILQRIIDRLERAQKQIDRHSMEHSNLFIAYFDREREGGAA